MADVPRLSDVQTAAETPKLEVTAPADEAESDGFLARLLKPRTAMGAQGSGDTGGEFAQTDEPEAAGTDLAEAEIAAKPEAMAGNSANVVAEAPGVESAPEPPRQRGLLGLFSGGGDPAVDVGAETDAAPPRKSAGTYAALAPGPEGQSTGPGIAPGTVLPYGKVARICNLPKRSMGKKLAQYPERSPVYRLYDSDPGNVGPHTFFLTGFADGCARQFTASLAVFGSAGMHEQLRYGLPAEVQPYSDTDRAYDKLKSRICKVPRRKPCGRKITRMERDTVFLSIYERYGSNARWMDILLHAGKIFAQDTKGG